MKTAVFLLTIGAYACGGSAVLAREISELPAPSDPASIAPPQQLPQNEVAARVLCRPVVVELDEGYGVSSRETRYVCPPPN